ncbi:SgcJ/EcaC family oxidoreductase [Archangium primigenium]|uniref:SgcJ/EcaC family oxidoreductase n=1 Tax=[Archangium] primigenium TaxID=2792470 RepID=UPI0019563746|nr:SgcJ/EcaC family oxidoreductase [Archangium primigenium]MBM7113974.1 SgcJ/EcaC family oxidoreductase [Archangium primigenium]
MSRILRATSLVALSLLFTACAHADRAQDELSIRQMVAAQTEAWNRQDAAAWTADFVADADFVNIVGTPFAGRQQIEERHAAIFNSLFKGSHAEVTVRRLVFLGEDAAVVDTTHNVTQYQGLPPGVQATEPGLLRTQMKYVLQRIDGTWRIVAGQNTDEKPRPQPQP